VVLTCQYGGSGFDNRSETWPILDLILELPARRQLSAHPARGLALGALMRWRL
jgi:hypothetical protein